MPKFYWDFPRLGVGLSNWANPAVFLAVGPEIPLSVLSLILFRLPHRSNESVVEHPRCFDHVGLLVDEPYGQPGCSSSIRSSIFDPCFSTEINHSPDRHRYDFGGAAREKEPGGELLSA